MTLARRALIRQTVLQREFSSSQLPIRLADLPAAKNELRRMRDEFIAKFAATEDGDSIYCFGFQFFNALETADGEKL